MKRTMRLKIKQEYLCIFVAWAFTWLIPPEVEFSLYKVFLWIVLAFLGLWTSNLILNMEQRNRLYFLSFIGSLISASLFISLNWLDPGNLLSLFFWLFGMAIGYFVAMIVLAFTIGILSKYIEVVD